MKERVLNINVLTVEEVHGRGSEIPVCVCVCVHVEGGGACVCLCVSMCVGECVW